MRRVALIAALALSAAACGGGAAKVADPQPTGEPVQAATVKATDRLTYEPKAIRLKAGGTVTWINDGVVPHTVTFSGFDEQLKAKGRVEFTFTTPGTTQVHCTLHPGMSGEIVVV